MDFQKTNLGEHLKCPKLIFQQTILNQIRHSCDTRLRAYKGGHKEGSSIYEQSGDDEDDGGYDCRVC